MRRHAGRGGYLLELTGHNWMITFWISAAIYLMGGLCWGWIDPVTPLENEGESPTVLTYLGGTSAIFPRPSTGV